jgi:hypothetical protein
LTMNKNILRVTGQSVDRLGFDIRNLETHAYKNMDDLFAKIKNYLDIFFKIKNLKYAPLGDLYKECTDITLPGTPEEIQRGKFWLTTEPISVFRDGGINIQAKFLRANYEKPGIGVILRRSAIGSGYFLKFCKNGDVQLVLFPEHKEIFFKKTKENFEKKFHALVDLQNDELEIKINETSFVIPGLELQNIGGIYLASFESQAEFTSVKTINRDTI